MLTLVVGLAAGVGAVCRFLVDQSVQHSRQRRGRSDFPWGTLLVNIAGSLVLGFAVGLHAQGVWGSFTATAVGTGFAGGFTTLSTWAWETLVLAEQGRHREAVANLVLSFGLGLAAAAGGLGLALL